MNEAVERVQLERRLRGWSIRAAAEAGGVSNQTWGIYEQTGRATAAVRRAVGAAFSWPENWPESLPSVPPANVDQIAELRDEMTDLKSQLRAALEVMAELMAELRRQSGAAPTTRAPGGRAGRSASAQ